MGNLPGSSRPTVGLALSGSGNRITFYIGFLEVLAEQGIPIDYIAASSGGSLVAAAFACGKLRELKDTFSSIDEKFLRGLIVPSQNKGGLYSLDLLEEELRKYTGNMAFEEVRPLLGFLAVDIENGELVLLSMGDIAKAARISCTLPGIFEPAKWGGRTLVDGGLLNQVPLHILHEAGMDIKIGINMRGTKFIFTETQLNLHRIIRVLRKLFFIEQIESWMNGLRNEDEVDLEEKPGIFTVLGKSLDLAIKASKQEERQQDWSCDLMITPDIPLLHRSKIFQFEPYYSAGREVAAEYAAQIKLLIEEKAKQMVKT